MTRHRRRTAPADPGHVQQHFQFFATMPDTPTPGGLPAKPPKIPRHLLPIDSAGFEPLPCDVRRIDNFLLHKTHAERLAKVRSFHRRPRLGQYIEALLKSFESDVPENAGEK